MYMSMTRKTYAIIAAFWIASMSFVAAATLSKMLTSPVFSQALPLVY